MAAGTAAARADAAVVALVDPVSNRRRMPECGHSPVRCTAVPAGAPARPQELKPRRFANRPVTGEWQSRLAHHSPFTIPYPTSLFFQTDTNVRPPSQRTSRTLTP